MRTLVGALGLILALSCAAEEHSSALLPSIADGAAEESWLLPHMGPPTALLTDNMLRNLQSHQMFNTTPVVAYIDGQVRLGVPDGWDFHPCTEPSLLTNPATLDSELSLLALKIWPVKNPADNSSWSDIYERVGCTYHSDTHVRQDCLDSDKCDVRTDWPRRIVLLSGDRVLTVVEHNDDARLFSYGGRAYMLCATDFFSIPTTPTGQLGIAKFALNGVPDPWNASHGQPPSGSLTVPDQRAEEKNWTPLLPDEPLNNNTLLLFYEFCPPRVISCDVESAACETYHEEQDNAACKALEDGGSRIHGGSPLIQVDQNTLIGVVHSDKQSNHTRRYTHRFVQAEATPPHRLLAFSPPFRFPKYFNNANDEIQFCPGIALTPDGKELVLTYGQGDAAALSVRVKLAKVMEVF